MLLAKIAAILAMSTFVIPLLGIACDNDTIQTILKFSFICAVLALFGIATYAILFL